MHEDTFILNIVATPDAGTNGALSICSIAPAEGLFPQLGGTPDLSGTWTFNASNHSGSYDPSIDAPGVYTYTVPGGAP